MVLGLRVIRGPDWNLGNKDGGDNHVGTVTTVKSKTEVVVTWDMGEATVCRTGKDGKHDIRVIDYATIGVIHDGVACSCCHEAGISGVRWQCSVCKNANLCTPCYFRDGHDTTHAFNRIDLPGSKPVKQAKRSISQRSRSLGIFPSARVARGPNWEYKDQDGGAGKEGTVEDVITWGRSMAERDAVRVNWSKGNSNVYRLGYKGKVDVVCKEKAPGPDFYPEHLGGLDVEDVERWRRSASVLQLGDKVCVVMSKSELRPLQESHRNWNSKMETIVGEIGEIKQFTLAGDIKIKFEDGEFTLNKAAVVKVPSLKKGDVVRVIESEATVQRLQNKHGGWDDPMKEVIGKVGTVIDIDAEGDVAVRFGDVAYVFNAACLQPAPGQKELILSTKLEESFLSSGSDFFEESVTGDLPIDNSDSSDEDDGSKSDTSDDNDDDGNMAQVLAGLLLLGQALQQNKQTVSDNDIKVHFVERVVSGDEKAVKSLLQKKPDLMKTTYKNLTMLSLATIKGCVNVMAVLLDAGMNINFTDSHQMAPLLAAIKSEELEAAEFLIQRGANVNISNFQKRTALHLAASSNMVNIVKLLLTKGGNINAQDKDGDTPLHDAIATYKNDVVALLVANPNADLWRKNNKDFNPLALACFKGNAFAVAKLVGKLPALATDDKTKTKEGFFPLHIAAINNHTGEANTLLTQGNADVNKRANNTCTPLHLAATKGFLDMVKLLLDHGADWKAKDKDGDTALHLCLSQRRTDPVLTLLGLNTIAEENERVQAAILLMKKGASIKDTNNSGMTPVSACWSSRMKDAVMAHYAKTGGKTGLSGAAGASANWSEQKCILCANNKADVVFTPCQHVVTCSLCCYRCRVCPVCHEDILQRRNTDGTIVLGENCTIS